MPFNRSAVERGREVMEPNSSGSVGGQYKAFLPNFFWKNNDDFRYLLFLNPTSVIPRFLMHSYVDIDQDFPEMVVARTDKSVGESADPLQERWGYSPAYRNLAVAVELEPKMKVINGREKPVGFQVMTNTFDRRVRDDEGNPLDDEWESVEAPRIGLVCQSPATFFSQIKWFDQNEGEIHKTPLKITRLNGQNSVSYRVDGYDDVELDLTGLLENIENVGYIQDKEALVEKLSQAKDEFEMATAIGDIILDQRIDELGDDEHYNNVLAQVSRPSRFAKNNRERKTQAKSEKPVQKARSRAEHEKVTRESPITKRLEELRKKKNA